MDWKASLTCFTPTYTEHKVGDQVLRFYPVSTGMLFKLRRIAGPIARSFTILFGNNDQDSGTDIIDFADGDKQTKMHPIGDGLAKIRHEQRCDAVEGIVNALTDSDNAAVIGEIIMDSLAEVFPKDQRKDWPASLEFVKEIPLPVLGGMIAGVINANKDVLGPLADRAAASAAVALDRVGRRADAAEATPG